MAAGFGRAPITKTLCFACAAASLSAWIANSPQSCRLDVDHTFRQAELWRLLTCHLVFETPMAFFFGMILLYTFREFERRLKTSRFLIALCVLLSLSTSIQLIMLLTGATQGFTAGPFAIIFGLFPFFFSEIPPAVKGGILFIPMSDKTFTYLFGLQLAFSDNFPSALWPTLCGLLAGILYRASWLPFRKLRLPSSCQRCCEWYCSYFDLSNDYRHRGGYQQVPTDNDPSVPQQLFGPPPSVPIVAADPQRVQTLVAMGFDEEDARGALARTNNNVQAAVGLLGSAW